MTKPRLVLLGHWENFFGNDLGEPARTIPLLGYKGLLEQLKPYNVVVPEPFSDILLPRRWSDSAPAEAFSFMRTPAEQTARDKAPS